MPLQVLVAFLARNQLSQALDDGTQAWTTLLETDFQRHTIIYSMYLLAIVTPSLHLVAFCLCIFLAIKFRRTSQLPIDVNPRGANPTSRGHKKAKSSVSILRTTSSHQYLEETSTKISSPLEPFVSTKTEPRASISSPNRRHNSNFIVSNHENTRASDIGRGRQSNKISYLASANQPRSSHTSRSIDSDLVRESEKWHVHPSILEHSHQRGPQELQHLRKQTLNHEYLRPAPLASISKYDFTKRSPRPLGLHPPTPREATPNSTNAFDTRALRDIDGNSSAPRVSNSVWDDINLELNSVDSSRVRIDTRKQYGDVVGMGRVMSSQARLVSSGVDTEVQSNSVRMREVSGKVVEEGRGRFIYRDF